MFKRLLIVSALLTNVTCNAATSNSSSAPIMLLASGLSEKALRYNWTQFVPTRLLDEENCAFITRYWADKVIAQVHNTETGSCLAYYFSSRIKDNHSFATYKFKRPAAELPSYADSHIEKLLAFTTTASPDITQGYPGLSGACRLLKAHLLNIRPTSIAPEHIMYFAFTYLIPLQHLIAEADENGGIISDPIERIMLMKIIDGSLILLQKKAGV